MTYKEIVHKIIHDHRYAKETAELLAKARRKDQAAIRELKERFKPLPAEIGDLGLKVENLERCDDEYTNITQFYLIDFAAFVE
jgi:hypothetical protein